jgi:CRP/FNR family transcriptional regulator, cyclic AMP receptor protein
MTSWDAIGYLAAGMVLLAFGMKDMIPLRIIALISNLAFITYGLGLGLAPVWLLHGILFPLNGWRLAQALQAALAARRLSPRFRNDAGPRERPIA